MTLLTNVYRWIVPVREPKACGCGRPGVHCSWGTWYCRACEAERAAEVWP